MGSPSVMSVGTVIVRKTLGLGSAGFMVWGSVVSGSVSTSSTYRAFWKRLLVFEGKASGLFNRPAREPELHGALVDIAREGTEIVLLFQAPAMWPGLSFEDRLEAYEASSSDTSPGVLVGVQDVQDLHRCVDFRIGELSYAINPRNLRCLERLRLTSKEACAEIERLVLLMQRLT